jgi:hypothetical protein
MGQQKKPVENTKNNNPDLLKALSELRGKTLGCWCVPDHECHGQVLIELFRQYVGTPKIPTFD